VLQNLADETNVAVREIAGDDIKLPEGSARILDVRRMGSNQLGNDIATDVLHVLGAREQLAPDGKITASKIDHSQWSIAISAAALNNSRYALNVHIRAGAPRAGAGEELCALFSAPLLAAIGALERSSPVSRLEPLRECTPR
jgi:hypothetical protein